MQIRLSDGIIHEVFHLNGASLDTIINVDGFESRFPHHQTKQFCNHHEQLLPDGLRTLANQTLLEMRERRAA